jgi:hypothetical protein
MIVAAKPNSVLPRYFGVVIPRSERESRELTRHKFWYVIIAEPHMRFDFTFPKPKLAN